LARLRHHFCNYYSKQGCDYKNIFFKNESIEFYMDNTTKEAINNILKSAGATKDEELLINSLYTANTNEINYSRVISEFLLTKQLEKATEKILESNKFLAEAGDKHAKKMQYLTWALVGVGALQASAIFISLFK